MGSHPALPEPSDLRGFCPRLLEKVAGEAPVARETRGGSLYVNPRQKGRSESEFSQKGENPGEMGTSHFPTPRRAWCSEEGCVQKRLSPPPPSLSEVVNPALSFPPHESGVQVELPDQANKGVYTKKCVVSLRPKCDLAATCAGDAGLFLSYS